MDIVQKMEPKEASNVFSDVCSVKKKKKLSASLPTKIFNKLNCLINIGCAGNETSGYSEGDGGKRATREA